MRDPRHMTEDDLQKLVVQTIRTCWKHIHVIHVPNQGTRSAARGKKLKAMGVTAGVADLLLWWNIGYGLNSAAIELKSKSGSLKPEQKAWGADFTGMGGKWACCKSLDQVVEALRKWGAI